MGMGEGGGGGGHEGRDGMSNLELVDMSKSFQGDDKRSLQSGGRRTEPD